MTDNSLDAVESVLCLRLKLRCFRLIAKPAPVRTRGIDRWLSFALDPSAFDDFFYLNSVNFPEERLTWEMLGGSV